MKLTKLSPFKLFIIGAIWSISNVAQAGPCINPTFSCVSNDLILASGAFTLISAMPLPCIIGSDVTVQLQADVVSGAGVRYDVGFWIAQDGGDAQTLNNTCFNDFLTPLLPHEDMAPEPPLIKSAPFYNLSTPENLCGDIVKGNGPGVFHTIRNIGATMVGTPAATALPFMIKCADQINSMGQPIPDGIVDISACGSWTNLQDHVCTMATETAPTQQSRCRCNRANIPGLTGVCTMDSQCTQSVPPNLCAPNRCINGLCVATPVICEPTDACFIAACDPATGICFQTPVMCEPANACFTAACALPGGNCVQTPVMCEPTNACFTASCALPDGNCVQTPVMCEPTNACFTASCALPDGNCVQTPVDCGPPPDCRLPGVCSDPGGCTFDPDPAQDGDPCTTPGGDPGFCEGGTCFPPPPPGGCSLSLQDCPPVVCQTVVCVPPMPPGMENICVYTEVMDGTPCVAGVCFDSTCVECITACECPGATECFIASCDALHVCSLEMKNCDTMAPPGTIKCTTDSCSETVPGGCVHMPSNDNCVVLEDQCNVAFCSATGGCATEPLPGASCRTPGSCDTGVCAVGADNSATCEITDTCTAPDTCSTANCNNVTGVCTITIGCVCHEFCDNAIPTGTCLQCDVTRPCEGNLECVDGVCVGCALDTDCQEGDECTNARCVDNACRYTQNEACCPVSGCMVDSDCKEGDECTIKKCINHECHYEQLEDCCPSDDQDCSRHVGSSHDQDRADRSGGRAPVPLPVPIAIPAPVPVPISIPVPVPVPIARPAPTPATTVVTEPVIAPINNRPNGFPDPANAGVKGAPGDSVEEESDLSCATTGTDIKDLWMWVMMLVGGYSMRRRKRAAPR